MNELKKVNWFKISSFYLLILIITFLARKLPNILQLLIRRIVRNKKVSLVIFKPDFIGGGLAFIFFVFKVNILFKIMNNINIIKVIFTI